MGRLREDGLDYKKRLIKEFRGIWCLYITDAEAGDLGFTAEFDDKGTSLRKMR